MATEVNGQQLVVCYYISSRSWLSHVCMCAVARSLQASDCVVPCSYIGHYMVQTARFSVVSQCLFTQTLTDLSSLL